MKTPTPPDASMVLALGIGQILLEHEERIRSLIPEIPVLQVLPESVVKWKETFSMFEIFCMGIMCAYNHSKKAQLFLDTMGVRDARAVAMELLSESFQEVIDEYNGFVSRLASSDE